MAARLIYLQKQKQEQEFQDDTNMVIIKHKTINNY